LELDSEKFGSANPCTIEISVSYTLAIPIMTLQNY